MSTKNYLQLILLLVLLLTVGMCWLILNLPGKVIELTPPHKVNWQLVAEVTRYNPVPGQTDDTPLVTASGALVNERTAACPDFLPFGTEITIEGERFVCQDRMALRYRSGNYFDLISFDYQEARRFGRQTKVVEIARAP